MNDKDIKLQAIKELAEEIELNDKQINNILNITYQTIIKQIKQSNIKYYIYLIGYFNDNNKYYLYKHFETESSLKAVRPTNKFPHSILKHIYTAKYQNQLFTKVSK